MTERAARIGLGAAALAAALFLVLYAIPVWVSTPSNVGNIVLSPLFWPYAIAGFTGLCGAALLVGGLRAPAGSEPVNEPIDDTAMGWVRLAGMAAIMVAMMALIETLGMVFASMLAFAATAFLMRTRHPVAAVVCAVVVPLVLYAFFAHVASVAIPQGEFVRLP